MVVPGVAGLSAAVVTETFVKISESTKQGAQ